MNRYPFITDEEFRSLLYYQGAIQNIDLKMLDTELTNFSQFGGYFYGKKKRQPTKSSNERNDA